MGCLHLSSKHTKANWPSSFPVSYAEIASKGPKQSAEEVRSKPAPKPGCLILQLTNPLSAQAAAPQPPEVNPVLSESVATTATSTGSLVDVDTPSVHTVPADYAEQTIKTETQADRIQRESEADLKELRNKQEKQAARVIKEAKKEREQLEAKQREEEEEEEEESAEAEAHPTAKSKKAKRKDKKKEKKQAADKPKAEKESTKAGEVSKLTNAGASGVRRLDAWLAHRLLDPVVKRSSAKEGTVAEGGEYAPATGALALANAAAVVALSSWLGFRAWGLYDRGRLGLREAGVGLGILGVVGAFEGVLVRWAAGRFGSAPPARG
ncbi:hypothetical protein VTJ49DRAFT_2579 [Mycothermus thermophilus]|uniref:Uncharacterized protein n=1 Tax=Humicola insolens TaxID=85995 RepID=A0ABR3VMW5_HUMIN